MRNSPVLAHRTPARRAAAPVAALAALATALVLGGCGSDDGGQASDPAAETTSAAPTTSAPVEPSESPSETATEPATPDPDVMITLETPADGATVSGSLDVEGTANSPEANVPWRILDAAGKKVAKGHFTAEGWMDKLYPYAGTVDVSKLAAGSYTFEVSIDDPSGGEGKAPEKVAVAITVQ